MSMEMERLFQISSEGGDGVLADDRSVESLFFFFTTIAIKFLFQYHR